VLASPWESQPLALIEAMMRSRPVVASEAGGIPEWIADGINGRLVPPSDAEALAVSLEWMRRNTAQAEGLGRRAAQSARETFGWDRVVDAYETVYDEVLGLASFVPEEEEIARSRG
jgi:glycosyltransferase involved in cell wall biosynthesis